MPVMRDAFLSFINKQQLFGPTDSILLAVSGGLDSVVMTELFREIGQPIGLAHVNFGMRGAESDGDEAFVRTLGEQLGVAVYVRHADTESFARERGISIQMAARELRYTWFNELAQAEGYAGIATAHHRDDAIETVLLNMTRGTGLAGLLGIAPKTGRLVRPLLFADRAELELYARERSLRWREDASNASDHYRRNRLRHAVLPVLRELNPALSETMATNIDRWKGAAALVRAEVEHSWQALAAPWEGGFRLPVEAVRQLPEWPFRLAEWLRPVGFAYEQTQSIAEALRSDRFGQVFASPTHLVLRDRDFLIIQPFGAEDAPSEICLDSLPEETVVNLGGPFQLRLQPPAPVDGMPVPRLASVAWLDADQLQFPLTIRPWRSGDRFHPLGLQGSQTIGNFLTNQKIPLAERARVWVLLSGERVAWVIGYRIDNRFRLTGQTCRVVRIELRNSDPEKAGKTSGNA